MSLNPFYRRYTSPDGHNYFLFSVSLAQKSDPAG